MQINLYDIIDAIENTVEGTDWYYYVPTGQIIGKNSEGFYGHGVAKELPMKDVIALPDHRTVDDYGNMERFAEYEVKGEAQQWLKNSIRGRGAFRRFRGTLERFLLTQDWYDYLFECHRNTAIDWCEQNGIVYTEEEPPAPEEDDDWYDDDYEEEPAPAPQPIQRTEPLRVVTVTSSNYMNLIFPAVGFDIAMNALCGRKVKEDADLAREHLESLIEAGEMIYAVSDRGRFVAYCVLHADRNILSMEELFTMKDFRRRKAATLLLKKAEEIAQENDMDLCFSILPENTEMIRFLKANGYHTLMRLQIGKDTGTDQTVTVNEETYYHG